METKAPKRDLATGHTVHVGHVNIPYWVYECVSVDVHVVCLDSIRASV